MSFGLISLAFGATAATAATVGLVGATIGGALLSSKASGKATQAQVTSTQAGIASQERQFQQALDLQEPFREAGYQAVEGIQDLTTQEGRQQALQGYFDSPEYQTLQGQASEVALRGQSAIGNLRGGSSYAALESIAPQLGQNYLEGQENRLFGLANLGIGAASQGASGAQNLGINTANLLQSQGTAQAQNALAQGRIQSQALGTLGGLAYNFLTPPPSSVI